MKKLIALICIFSVLLTLCGCASEKQESPKATDNKIVSVSATPYFAVALKDDGTVEVSDANGYDFATDDWQNVVKVVAAPYHYGSIIAALSSDGMVYAKYYDLVTEDVVAVNTYNQETTSRFERLLKHDNIIDIATNGNTLFALTDDGKLVVSNINQFASVYDVFENYKDVKSIGAGESQIIGVKQDGTLMAEEGPNILGGTDIDGFSDIVQLVCVGHYTIGLKNDGTVVTPPFSTDESLMIDKDSFYNVYGELDFDDWTDIKTISASKTHTVGLKGDGTVVATGDNENGQCDVGDWKDIIAISCCPDATYGLKSDGTIVSTGNTSYRFD